MSHKDDSPPPSGDQADSRGVVLHLAASRAGKQPQVRDLSATEFAALMAGANAPIIFADAIASAGVSSGLVSITLNCTRAVWVPSGAITDTVAVAHLRLTDGATRALLEALQRAKALLDSNAADATQS